VAGDVVTPTWTIIIAARNEKTHIREKIENTIRAIEGYPAAVQILVASDASDDGTDEIVSEYKKDGVQLVRAHQRNGKEWIQAEAVGLATGSIILFTDAKVALEVNVLSNLTKYFTDQTVGAVSTIDKVVGGGVEGSGEGFYIKYEMFLRKLETKVYSVVGLSGSGFAVRREIAKNIKRDIPSDFALLIECISQGKRGVLADNVVCSYKALLSEEDEFNRKVRTILRGITALMKSSYVFNPAKYGLFSFEIISHKLIRWLVPVFFLMGTFSAFIDMFSSTVSFIIGITFILFYLMASFAFVDNELRRNIFFKIPLFFIITNSAIAVSWIKYLTGSRAVFWNPSEKGK